MVVEVMVMKEENNAPKNKWSDIFRKKWFFPAVYLTIAALLLSVVVWYQNMDNQVPDAQEDSEMTGEYNPSEFDEDAEAVLDQQEVIKMAVQDKEQAEIVTKFYDYNAEQDEQENGLVLYNNRYYQSTGIDIASAEGEAFDVVASLSGTVTEVKEDPLLGNDVVVSHENDVMTYYASLNEVEVKADSEVKQGDAIGTAGKTLFGKDNGTQGHCELRKDGIEVDPESFFNQPVSELDKIDVEKEEEEEAEQEGSESESDEGEDAEATEEDAEATEEEEQQDDIEVDSEQENPEADEEDQDEDPAADEEQDEEEGSEDEDLTDETSDSSASSASA